MLDLLAKAEEALPGLLADADAWGSLKIDYHPPFVDRLWRNWEDHRLNLHRIHPCDPGEALFHPHPWPSAMVVLDGDQYEMAVGYGSGDDRPPHAARIVAPPGLRYEMTDKDAWHYVRPINRPVITLMITGKPWDRSSPGPDRRLARLDDATRDELLSFFRDRYPK